MSATLLLDAVALHSGQPVVFSRQSLTTRKFVEWLLLSNRIANRSFVLIICIVSILLYTRHETVHPH